MSLPSTAAIRRNDQAVGNMYASIVGIETAVPEGILDNQQLESEYPGWSADKIFAKTGIRERRIAADDQCGSDLATQAANRLFERGVVRREDVDFVLYCTQTPDFFLPTTACLLHHSLGLPTSCGATDINLGCSGYVYGLSLAKALVESGQAQTVLLVTADTYSKIIHPADKSVRTLFGDAAAATLLRGNEEDRALGPFVFGTDGAGAHNLIVPAGGMRQRFVPNASTTVDDSGNARTVNHLFMNGTEIFNFTLRVVPDAVSRLLDKAGIGMDAVDLFVFHQANGFMLEHLRRKLGIPAEKFVIALEHVGNTVSSSIPIALGQAAGVGQLRPGMLIMLVGFGVGYSWGATLVRWV